MFGSQIISRSSDRNENIYSLFGLKTKGGDLTILTSGLILPLISHATHMYQFISRLYKQWEAWDYYIGM